MSDFPKRVLLATDGSEEVRAATRAAVDLLQITGAELHVVHVVPPAVDRPPWTAASHDPEEARREAQELLEKEVGRIEHLGAPVAEAHLGVGRVDGEVVALAEDLAVDLVVVGSRGRGGLKRALLGSVSESVVRHAHCPVLVVRPSPAREPVFRAGGRVLVAVDGSENAALAARRAAALAGATGAELHVASVGEHHVSGYYEEIIKEGERQAQEVLAGQVERIEEAGGAISATHVRVGQPAAEIVALGEELEADLLVVGDRGLSGLRRILMGSVADSVVRYAHCPVLMVRDQVGGK